MQERLLGQPVLGMASARTPGADRRPLGENFDRAAGTFSNSKVTTSTRAQRSCASAAGVVVGGDDRGGGDACAGAP